MTQAARRAGIFNPAIGAGSIEGSKGDDIHEITGGIDIAKQICGLARCAEGHTQGPGAI